MPKLQPMFVFLIFMIIGSCNDAGVESIPPDSRNDYWEEVEIFKNSDIRCIKIFNGSLYVSAVNYSSSEILSILIYTNDGLNWDTLKSFSSDIGPFTFYGDTLILVETGAIWEYHPSFNWRIKHEMLIAAWLTRDIITLNDDLFVFENKYFSISNDSIHQINTTETVSKFVKHLIYNKEIAYTIPYYIYDGYPLKFDGKDFIALNQGISETEHLLPNYPAITIYKDTLYAGFNTPTMIKRYCYGKWENILDSLVLPQNGQHQESELSIIISAIHFENDNLFLGTKQHGIFVLEGNEWKLISKGLKQAIVHGKIYFTPIIFLEYYKGYIFTGYGEPSFAPIYNGRGLFKYKYNERRSLN